jgi:aryl-alcohol dehydrogenase-like predicted oxidoreductase
MPLETRNLGRTHLPVSLLGLGTGGNSRLGLSKGLNEAHAAGVVRAALDMGITLLDTARVYQTEHAVGLALRGGQRDQVVLSSKSPYLDANGELLTAQAFQANLETSLQMLGVEVIDIYFIHGLALPFYESSRERFLPVLERARQAGKIRFFGITEAFERDFRHEMLTRALQDDDWDVMMVGFNFLNPSAREQILTRTRQKGIGILGMFAVRRGLIDDTWLRILLKRLAERGEIDPGLASSPDLMDSLGLRGASLTLSEAAYRFCAFEQGLDCTLTGTSSIEHLSKNLTAIQRGPLPDATLARLEQLFGQVNSLSGQVIIE